MTMTHEEAVEKMRSAFEKRDISMVREIAQGSYFGRIYRDQRGNDMPGSPGHGWLIEAAAIGFAEALPVLIAAGASPDVRDAKGVNALTHAVKARHEECAFYLADKGGTIGAARGCATPLMIAARMDWPEMVEALLPWSDPEEGGDWGSSVLFEAAAGGALRSIEALLPSGGLRQMNSLGMTPFEQACYCGQEAAARRLMAELDPESEEDQSLLESGMFNAAAGGSVGCVAMMLARGPHMALLRDGDGRTPLMRAAESGSCDCIELLLCSSDLAAVDKKERTALDLARAEDRKDAVKLLEAVELVESERKMLRVAAPAGQAAASAARTRI